MKKISLQTVVSVVVLVASVLAPHIAFAGTTMPWDTTLQKIADDLTGTTAFIVATLAIVGSGAAMMFMDLQGGAKRLIQAALGAGIALLAVSLLSALGFSKGIIIR